MARPLQTRGKLKFVHKLKAKGIIIKDGFKDGDRIRIIDVIKVNAVNKTFLFRYLYFHAIIRIITPANK